MSYANAAPLPQYDGDLKLPARFLVAPPAISGTSGERWQQSCCCRFATCSVLLPLLRCNCCSCGAAMQLLQLHCCCRPPFWAVSCMPSKSLLQHS